MIRMYVLWGLLLVNTAYLGWLLTVEVPSWFFWTSFWLLNPLAVLFFAMLWFKRDTLVATYYMMLYYWRDRRDHKDFVRALEARREKDKLPYKFEEN